MPPAFLLSDRANRMIRVWLFPDGGQAHSNRAIGRNGQCDTVPDRIDPPISPDQLRVLAQTGLGDGIVISDANFFPSVPVARGTMQVVNDPDALPTVFVPMARLCDESPGR